MWAFGNLDIVIAFISLGCRAEDVAKFAGAYEPRHVVRGEQCSL